MKKIFTMLIMLSLMLTGCSKTDALLDGKKSLTAQCFFLENPSGPLPFTDSNEPFFADEDKAFFSYDELQEYIGRIEKCDITEDTINKLSSYDENFFEDNMLYYAYEFGNGNVKHEFVGAALTENADAKPFIEIYVNTDWRECVESGATYGYFVEFEKSNVETVDDDGFVIVTCSD